MEGLVQSIHPCTGCDLNQLIQADQVLCSKWSKRTSVIGILTDLSTQKRKKELSCSITALIVKIYWQNKLFFEERQGWIII